MFRAENAQSLLGLAVILGLCWVLSENRRVFPW
jgi:CNT family concentrative nucleoside transporter